MKWRIYYDNGTTFDSSQGMPEDAPAFGVQCIVFPDKDHGRTILQRFDWYYWKRDENEWWAGDLFGVLDLFMHQPKNVTALKAGRNVSNTTFQDILHKAVHDPDFDPKTGTRNGESRW